MDTVIVNSSDALLMNCHQEPLEAELGVICVGIFASWNYFGLA